MPTAGEIAANEIALGLASSRARVLPIERSLTHATGTLEDAYAVQRALMQDAVARGRALVGYKIGTTSAAAMRRIGVTEPLFGFLERDDAIADAGNVDLAALIAPRIEMELAFVTGDVLDDASCDRDAVLAATAYVVPALEIIDSRYVAGPFDVVAAVADNMSTARHVVGRERFDPRVVDVVAVSAVLEKNGTEVARGTGADVLGDPAASVAWLVRALVRCGASLPAGSLVLSGGFADALPCAAGDVFVARWMPAATVSCTFAASAGR